MAGFVPFPPLPSAPAASDAPLPPRRVGLQGLALHVFGPRSWTPAASRPWPSGSRVPTDDASRGGFSGDRRLPGFGPQPHHPTLRRARVEQDSLCGRLLPFLTTWTLSTLPRQPKIQGAHKTSARKQTSTINLSEEKVIDESRIRFSFRA